ncbi:MAG: ATP-binding protein [Planctomycetaceae bacterium]|nr:ATP-binding protein [Planctomycetaceae bacterium]
MADWERNVSFQVDIAGIIDIMGVSLYSRQDTPIRELIQNAHDAITRRQRGDLSFQGRIDVRQNSEVGTISFSDDGVGLTHEEAEKYLGTLGSGITGLIKRGEAVEELDTAVTDQGDLIGQFGVGLFSAFMLADRLIVETKSNHDEDPVRWEAGAATDIQLSRGSRETPGTTVTLALKKQHVAFAKDAEKLERAIREHADFLPVPIYLNDNPQRVNVIHAAWFEATQDEESTELALQEYFDETPLDVIPVRMERPISIAGALYVTPQRVPGFNDLPTVMVTIRRMVISRKIQGLLPPWATFIRGCLELHDCSPTASREDLVRNSAFDTVQGVIESALYDHFEGLVEHDLQRLEAIVNWHRYTFAGASLENARLRQLLRRCYRFPTSHGSLTIEEIFAKSDADPLYEEEAEKVIWFNTDRRQEQWVNSLFSGLSVPCVHTFRSFEESLLALCVSDENSAGTYTDLRIATPSAPNFANTILGVTDLEDAEPVWTEFFDSVEAKILVGSFRNDLPVMSFLNERYELAKTFDEMKQRGEIPPGFQRLIDSHFQDAPVEENEVILNRSHPMVARVLSRSPSAPLASVLRLIVINSLNSAGAATPASARKQQQADLDWIAECLWGRDE